MADETTTLRRCIGSTRFGIEPHEAPVEDFPAQPSQKDGFGRMCRTHWNQYTTALRKAALTRNAEVAPTESEPAVAAPEGSRGRKAKGAQAAKPEPVAEVEPEPVAG